MASTNEKQSAIKEEDDVVLTAEAQSSRQPDADTASIHSRRKLDGFALKIVIFALCLAQFLAALDITIVATALPTIAKQVNVTSAQYTWIGSSYNLASTASTPLWGKCSDIWGRKPLLLTANAAFMAGSLIAGLANTSGILIGGRTLQGLGSGGIVIMVTIIIADLFPLRERAKYYGFLAVVWAIASALGPVLGGVFTQTAGWRWCFFINLPFDAASLGLLWFVLRLKTPRMSLINGLKAFDWLGSLTIVSGTICFLCGLEGGASGLHGWVSAYTLCLLVFGVVLIGCFVICEMYFASFPLVPMRVFVGRVNIAALTSASFHGFCFISYDYFLPIYFQIILGVSPIMSGVYLLSLVIPLSCCSAATGAFIKSTGDYHHAAWFGSIVMAVGTGLFIDFGSTYILWKIIVYQVIAGVGAGPLFLSPMLALQNHLRKEDIATGSSAFTFLRSITTSISIVVGGVIIQKGIESSSLATIGSGQGSDNFRQKERYTQALSHLWIFYTAISGLVVISALLITKHDQGKESKPEG